MGVVVWEAIRGMAARVRGLLLRAVVHRSDDDHPARLLQVETLEGELEDDVEQIEPYGVAARPLDPDGDGAPEAVVAAIGGDTDHAVVLLVQDRRYRIQGMEQGEVALYDDQGQYVWIQRSKIVIQSAHVELGAGAVLEVARRTDPIEAVIPAGTYLISSGPDVKNPLPLTIYGTITDGSATIKAVD